MTANETTLQELRRTYAGATFWTQERLSAKLRAGLRMLHLVRPRYPPLTPERLEEARRKAAEYGLAETTHLILNPLENYTFADWARIHEEAEARVAARLATPQSRRALYQTIHLSDITWWEGIKLALGIGDPRLIELRHKVKWIKTQILASCQASHLHSPGEKREPPKILDFAPHPDAPDADPAFSFLLRMPPGVNINRVNDHFLSDLKARLGDYNIIEVTFNSQGAWLRIPQKAIPEKAPKCRLEDLGAPPQACKLPLPLGMTRKGPLWVDLATAPHALFAGATGSGKSTLIHACLEGSTAHGPSYGLLYRAEVWGIDLKMVELSRYEKRMHRLALERSAVEPLLTDLLRRTHARLAEMRQRGVNMWRADYGARIVLVIDELAEVTLTSRSATDTLLRLAQIGRAAGVHLLLATQRPSVQIIPGDLKANIPLRVAFALPTGADSRVVLDALGAEDLTPPGDAYVLLGHQILRVSTPNFQAPPMPQDIGDPEDERLFSLSDDERAALRAIESGRCENNVKSLRHAMHWGDQRARKALGMLRNLRLVAAAGAAEDAAGDAAEDRSATDDLPRRPETAAPGAPDAPDAPRHSDTQNTHTAKRKPCARELRSKEQEERQRGDPRGARDERQTETNAEGRTGLSADAQAVWQAIGAGHCRASQRSVKDTLHLSSDRALAALQELRAAGLLPDRRQTPSPDAVAAQPFPTQHQEH